ncbi:MAG: hypothetical protein E6R03_16225 [Hyphomicrobiaceae bacterium]|nr:MAG: hypothetical protein E6R03_16225 [Hyphomicrobiaceae bacterium]
MPLFLTPDDSTDNQKLKASLHAIVTSSSIVSFPDAPEGARADNAWKWKIICGVVDRTDIDIFSDFPVQKLWDTQLTGNLQAVQYVADLRVQALRHVQQADLWDDHAEVLECLAQNIFWHARARARMDIYWTYQNDKLKTTEPRRHA